MRTTLAVLAVALSGCQPWVVVREAHPNPLAGKTSFGLQSLDWGGVWVDGVPEDAWMTNHEDWLKDWPGNKSVGATAFRKGVDDKLGGGPLSLLRAPDPTGASLILRPAVMEIDTGGRTTLKISVKVLDAKGATLEEISTAVRAKVGGSFEAKLADAASAAGRNVATWLQQRTQN